MFVYLCCDGVAKIQNITQLELQAPGTLRVQYWRKKQTIVFTIGLISHIPNKLKGPRAYCDQPMVDWASYRLVWCSGDLSGLAPGQLCPSSVPRSSSDVDPADRHHLYMYLIHCPQSHT